MKNQQLLVPEKEAVSEVTEIRHVAPPHECDLGVKLSVLTPDQQADACEEQIRQLAYQKWEQAGCPSGDGFDFWIEAERQVLGDPELT